MSERLQQFLRNRIINGWRLFWLISAPMCALVIYEMTTVDMSTGPGVSSMIGYSVRFAVPIIFLVVAISSLQVLFPGPLPAWLLRNRKYIGLCFAVAMAWQGTFIGIMSTIYSEHYYENVFYFRDELEGSTGYIFLAAMVLTSFKFASKHLSARQWKVLHKAGLYFLWAYPFSTYWWAMAGYYSNVGLHDHVFYWIGFTAFALRIVAWGKKRMAKSTVDTPLPYRIAGSALAGFGLIVAATPANWQESLSNFLTGPAWSANLELWLPFWPFEPFLSLFVIALGTMLFTRAGSVADDQQLAPQTAN